jgi:fatty-acyl-CoA synthase
MRFESLHHTSIGDLLSRQATEFPDRPFISFGDKQMTYTDVEGSSQAFASSCIQMGLKPKDRLALLLPNDPTYVIALFGAVKAGLVLVPINIRRSPAEVLSRLSKTSPRALVTFSEPEKFKGIDHLALALSMQPELPGLNFIFSKESKREGVIPFSTLLQSKTQLRPDSPSSDTPAAIIHTLGRDGQPRGAILSHHSLVRNAADMGDCLECDENDVFLGAVPFSNTFGLTATILSALIAGAQVVCLDKYHPGRALELIEGHQVTVHHGVPTMFGLELNYPEFASTKCASLRTGIMSGAPCPPLLARRVRQEMGINLVLAYGLTEASPSVTMTHLDDGPVTATETVGRPMPGVELKIIDSDGKRLENGDEGELCVRGYNVMSGYWDDPEATSLVLDDRGWLRTGDLAVIDPDGPVRIVGRKDEVIIRGGFKLYPGMVEMVLRSYPGVKETAVVGVPDLVYGELSVACVVRQEGAQFQAEDLQNYAAGHLADYALPDRVLFFEALPRRASGVVRKGYLRERARIRGRAWKFGKNIDTDAIIPARHCNTADPRELAVHCMEDADPDFVDKMDRGDLIIAETNFGCGSSREVAPLTIKAAGVSAVIAKSYARIFFRNAINIGLPILESPDAVDGITQGDEVEVEPATGTIRNLTQGTSFMATPFPDFLQHIIDRGGLLAYVEDRLAAVAD